MSELTTNQNSDFSFTVNPEAAASIHDDGIVILHTGKGCIYSSNGTGARVWRCVEQRLSLEAIANEISGAYQIARTTAREHALRFLAELERHMLIERRAES
jgi:UDP-N-acetylglucosamine transferase subunit ALG13